MPMRSLALLAASALLLTACRNTRIDANIAEQMTQVGVAISGLQQDQSMLQEQVDSLRQVVARQDTIITRLAMQANLQLPQR